MLLAALSAAAGASITAYAEPPYTKTATTDNFYWQWQAVNGINLDTNQIKYEWWMCYRTYRDGLVVEDSNGTLGWTSPNCWLARGANPNPSSGTAYTYPFQTSTVLQNGSRYEMCVTGYHIYGYYDSYRSTSLLWDYFPTQCNSSTIDRDSPIVAAAIDGTAEVTSNPALQLQIAYSDPTSPPWFGSDGRASNWTCLSLGTPCSPGGAPDPNCSVPANKYGRSTSFSCEANVSAQPDGKWYFCAKAADAAVLDNPSGTNQFVATSAQANISAVACGYVTLDRRPPTVTAQASATSVKVGQLVTFTASATDPSGVSGQIAWDFGDNTSRGSGTSVTHTYTQPGTYQAKASTSDGAGNAGTGTVTITVAPSGGGDTGGSGSGTGSGSGSGTGSDTGAGKTTGATPTTRPTSPGTISTQAGGGGSQTTSLSGMKVTAPKRFTAGKRTVIIIALSTPRAGTVTVQLRRSSKVIAKKGAFLGARGTYLIRLPVAKSLKAGSYTLRISFKAKGARTASTKTVKLTVVRARAARAARAATVHPPAPVKGVPGGFPTQR